MSDPAQRTSPPADPPKRIQQVVEAWIAAPPSLLTDFPTLNDLLDAMIAVLRPFARGYISTNGLGRYHFTPRGRQALNEDVEAGVVSLLMIEAESPWSGSILCDRKHGPDTFVEVSLQLPVTVRAPGTDELRAIISFLDTWVERLGAAVAFLFEDPLDKRNLFDDDWDRAKDIHDVAILQRRPRLLHWWAALRYTRGPGWGTYLGPDLCARLGGPERVARDAPVHKTARMGDGVWLQLWPTVPAPRGAYPPLIQFLAPLYDWTAYAREYVAWEATRSAESPDDTEDSKTESSEEQAAANATVPPIRKLPNADRPSGSSYGTRPINIIAVNIHAAGIMTDSQRRRLRAAIYAWFESEHEKPEPADLLAPRMSEPEITRRVARFAYGGLELSYDEPIGRLASRLATIPGLPIAEIVLGLEEFE